MLVLKQNTANSVPTPPAGKGTIFLTDQDDLAVKTNDGNVTTFPTVGGANTQVFFNDDGAIGANANLTFNKSTQVLTVGGNVAATGVKTDNLYYANGQPWDLSDLAVQIHKFNLMMTNHLVVVPTLLGIKLAIL